MKEFFFFFLTTAGGSQAQPPNRAGGSVGSVHKLQGKVPGRTFLRKMTKGKQFVATVILCFLIRVERMTKNTGGAMGAEKIRKGPLRIGRRVSLYMWRPLSHKLKLRNWNRQLSWDHLCKTKRACAYQILNFASLADRLRGGRNPHYELWGQVACVICNLIAVGVP